MPFSFIQDETKRIYICQKGIFRDKETTKHLTPDDDLGVTVSILHTGDYYPDALSENGLIYHYPKTNLPQRDLNDICATKRAGDLDLPIFVVIKKGRTSELREIKLGWVKDFGDKDKEFRIEFAEENHWHVDEDHPFRLFEKGESKTTLAKSRRNQFWFRDRVLDNYGSKCAVCDMTHPKILDAAHICGKEDSGSGDWRNGIVFCKNHHSAFDSGLFKIDPKSLKIKVSTHEAGKNIQIKETKLNTATGKSPHKKALMWRWKN